MYKTNVAIFRRHRFSQSPNLTRRRRRRIFSRRSRIFFGFRFGGSILHTDVCVGLSKTVKFSIKFFTF
jgi:hypothetical protein